MRTTLFATVFLVCTTTHLYAEGSRELNNSTNTQAYRVLFDFGYAITGSTKNWYKITSQDSILSNTRFYVYANVGDSICLASSTLGYRQSGATAGGNIVLYKPDGSLHNTWTATGGSPSFAGYITPGAGSKNRETYGPFGIYNGGTGGFTPIVVVADVAGVWTVECSSPSPSATNASGAYAGSGCQPRTNQDFVQPGTNNTLISAIDVSIIKNGQIVTGRVYTTFMSLTAGNIRQPAGCSPRPYLAHYYTLYMLSREGIRYDVTYNGMIPYGYLLYADNVGLQLADGVTPAYESAQYQPTAPTNRRIHRPSDAETAAETKHKMFFNVPDASMPATALCMGETIWLNPEAITPSYNFNFAYTLQYNIMPLDGYFAFNFPNLNMGYQVQLDLDNNGSYTDAVDVTLTGTTVIGTNTIAWDGRDGLGNPFQPDFNCYSARLVFNRSEIHVPLADVEHFRSGIEIRRVNGTGTVPDYTIYWNDNPLNDNNDWAVGGISAGPPPVPAVAFLKASGSGGVNSGGGVHRWEQNETGVPLPGYTGQPTHSISYGDTRFIDNWAFSSIPEATLPAFVCGLLSNRIEAFNAGLRNHNDVLLSWRVKVVEEGSGWLQQSADGQIFTNLTPLAFTNGNRDEQYGITQQQPAMYYRLAVPGRNGTFIYSAVKKIVLAYAKATFSLQPNPAKQGQVRILLADGERLQQVMVRNASGAVAYKTNGNGATGITLQLQQLPAGYYVVAVQDQRQQWRQQPLIIQ
jgi:hypothetical protein